MSSEQVSSSDRSRLPPELQLMVIDQLRHDKPSLRVCSLVSSTWLLGSRPHLFRDVTLEASKDDPNRFTDFLQFLEAGKESLAKLIVVLRFEGKMYDYDETKDDLQTIYQDYLPLSLDTLRTLLLLLPNLDDLTFHNVLFCPPQDSPAWAPNMPLAVPALPDGFPQISLKWLSIVNCSAPEMDLRLLFAVICTFTCIGGLIVNSGPWRLVGPGILWERMPPIEFLELTNAFPACSGAMVFMLKKLDAYGAPLRSLTINPRDVFNMGHLFELLLPALGSVRFEDMDLYIFHLINLEYPETEPIEPELIFPPIPTLVTLRLGLHCRETVEGTTTATRGQGIRNAIRVYAHLLADPTRLPALEKLTLEVFDAAVAPEVFQESIQASQSWRNLTEALLALPAFRCLEIVLSVSSPDNPTEETKQAMEAFLAEHLPELVTGRKEPMYRVILEDERDLAAES